MAKKSISKMENKKARGPSDVVSEMIKAAGEVGVDMITDPVNLIVVVGCIRAAWELDKF